MTWMNRRVSPLAPLAHGLDQARGARGRSGRRRCAGAARSARRGCPSPRRRGRPGCPSAKRAYQSRTSGVTWPSSVARHGTMAGTHVRSAATVRAPRRIGENQRARPASSRVGQRAGGSACRTRRLGGGAAATGPAYRAATARRARWCSWGPTAGGGRIPSRARAARQAAGPRPGRPGGRPGTPAVRGGARPRTARRGRAGAAPSVGRGGRCCRGPPRACSDSSGRAAGRAGGGARRAWDPRAGARSADCSPR